jgi:NDP-sugar pyrophosphorylase family protein
MVERLVLHLVGHGVRTIYLAVNYLAQKIEDHFGDGSDFGCSIRYLREDDPLGTAGALSLLPEPPSNPILVMNGDLVTQADIRSLLGFHQDGGYAATVALRSHSVTLPYGVASTSEKRLKSLTEKPTQEFLVNAGLYVLSPEVLSYVTAEGPYHMTDLFQELLQDDLPVGAFKLMEDWMDVGHPSDLMRAQGRTDPWDSRLPPGDDYIPGSKKKN